MKLRGLFTLLVGALLLGVGCTTDVDIDTSGVGSEGNKRTVRINATLPDLGGATRAAESDKGGVSNINWEEYQLRVIVKAVCNDNTNFNGETAYESVITRTDATSAKQDIELAIDLTAGHTYDIYLWADFVGKDGGDLHYDTSALPHVTLVDGLGINDETYDAFFGYGKASVGNSVTNWNDDFSVERAVAKLRLIGTDADRESVAKAELQLNTFYNAINIATGEVAAATAAETSGVATLEDYDADLDTENAYVTTYVLWPAEGSTTLSATFYNSSDNALSTITPTNAIPLKRGHLTTLRGEMLEKAWDGTAEEPTVIEDGWLVISTPGELLWLAENAPEINGTQYTQIRLGDSINAKDAVNIAALKIYDNTVFDGNGKTLSDLGAAPASALFGSAQGLNAYNFTLEGYNVTAADSHAGVLVNELSQSATFKDITIKSSSATTSDGAAGGVVGYINGGADSDLEVTFANCDLVNVKADGTLAEGKFVGLMHGYDNGEILSFDAECSADAGCAAADYVSPYTESNDAQWLDEGTTAVDFTNYDGWLGDEENYRAVVNFGGNRMQIKWDGVTKITPLKDASGASLIYSPFDLASLQQTVTQSGTEYPYKYTWSNRTNHGTVTFMSDVDLGGVCEECRTSNCICTRAGKGICNCSECRKFTPIYSIKTLNGNNHTVYNLHVEMTHDGNHGAGFMQTTVNGSNHKDLNFIGANIKTDHDRNIPICTYGQEDNGSGNAYAGTFVAATGGGTYTIDNIKVSSGKVSGVCKIGGLIGRATCSTLNMTNCSVDNYIVENYEANRPNYYPIVMTGGTTVTCLDWWYTQGECGGLIGFVQCSSTANIEGCSVTNTNMNCYGQEDKKVTANLISGSYSGMSPETKDSTTARGRTLIAGRHVNQFIGDVVSARTSDSNTSTYVVNIRDYTVSGNSYINGVSASSTNDYNHDYARRNTGSSWRPNYVYDYCEVVGCAYYVGVEINVIILQKHVRHYAGTLTFNKKGGSSTTLTETASEANGIKWTGGDFEFNLLTDLGGKTSYPAAPTNIGE